jgi:LacI family transcriptional regulator
MPREITLQDVAAQAKVHRTTVSLALRNHPSIPQKTRARIQAISRKLGYRANPFVTALMRSRRTGQAVRHAVIAYLTNHPTRYGWRPPELIQPDFFSGAARSALALGYKLEHFWMAEPGMTADRMSDILSARGINAVLIGRLPAGLHKLELDWERFSSVALGLTLESPRLHHVAEDHFHTARRAMQICIEHGYRRIGFVFTTPNDYPRVDDRWLGGYLCQQLHLEPENRIPPHKEWPDDRAQFLRWFRKHRPDAIIASHAALAITWLRDAGYRIPQDVALADLRNEDLALNHSGMYNDPARIGVLGVEMLTGLIHRNEIGCPAAPHEVLLPGQWRPGATLPACNR